MPTNYDTWKTRSDRDDGPQDEPPVDAGPPDQQEEGFLELLATAKAFVEPWARYDEKWLASEIATLGREGRYNRELRCVIAFRAAIAKAEP